mgnify:CR=1 FL=1
MGYTKERDERIVGKQIHCGTYLLEVVTLPTKL